MNGTNCGIPSTGEDPRKEVTLEKKNGSPPIDVAEMEGELVINVEIPGLDPKDIDVSRSEGTLFIKGEKKPETEEKEEDYLLLERNYGTFTRSIRRPVEVQSNKISASYKNGVLIVVLPKSERAQKKEIKIKVE